jgi:hypothetical protein
MLIRDPIIRSYTKYLYINCKQHKLAVNHSDTDDRAALLVYISLKGVILTDSERGFLFHFFIFIYKAVQLLQSTMALQGSIVLHSP